MYGLIFGISFLVSLILWMLLVQVRHVKIARFLLYGNGLGSFWLLMEAFSYYIAIPELAIWFQKAKYLSVIFIPPLYLLTAWEYTNRKKQGSYFIPLLFAVPFLSLLSLITNAIPYEFMADASVTYSNGTPLFTYTPKLGFWLHTLYSYSNILIVCWTLWQCLIHSPKLYRRQSLFIFAGSVLSLVINILALTFNLLPLLIDFTPISMLITLIILYWCLFRLPKLAMIPLARELLVENIKDIAIITDSADKILDMNPAGIEFLANYGGRKHNYKPLNIMGMGLREVLSFIPNIKQVNSPVSSEYAGDTLTVVIQDKALYFKYYQSLIYDTDRLPIGRLYMLHDITEMQEYVNNLQHLNDELLLSDRVINATIEGIMITDATGTIVRVNSAFENMAGYSKAELIGSNPRMLKSNRHEQAFYAEMWSKIMADGYWEGEIWDKRKNGEIYPKWMSINTLKQSDGILDHYIAVSTDITKIKRTEEALHSLSYYDSLTGIPNRTLLYERLEMAIIRAKDNEKAVALLFMDLDEFKVINDSLGHAAGDLLLKEVASRIETSIRKSDTVSRLGGDEFAVVLENIKDLDYVKSIAEFLIRKISLPYVILGREITLGTSIGIALYPSDETTVEGLARKADAAMYDAKAAGKGRYSFSSAEIEKRSLETLEIQILLNKALANREFRLYLQPQIAFTSERYKLVGAEALIRWETMDGKIFTPDKFIPLSENNGMIIPIGNWILEEIFQMDQVLKSHGIHIKLAVNVSSKQFENDSLVLKIREILAKNSAIDLVIEITESFLLKDLNQAIANLLEIKELGIRIALDDFGTGFSSLNYLTRLPISYLKIDKSFIDDIADPARKNLTPHIISMAKTLGVKTVAEGVETQAQIDRLVAESCDELQGYYFSKPIDIDAFISFAKQYV